MFTCIKHGMGGSQPDYRCPQCAAENAPAALTTRSPLEIEFAVSTWALNLQRWNARFGPVSPDIANLFNLLAELRASLAERNVR